MVLRVWTVNSLKPMALVTVALSAILLCSGGSFGEQDQNLPVVTVRIDQREQHVQVLFDRNGSAEYTGEISAEVPIDPNLRYVIAEISYRVDRGWPVNGTIRLSFPKGISTHQFSCNVTVPERTSMNDTGILSVLVEWRTEPEWKSGNTTDSAAIIIEPFSKLTVLVEEGSRTVGKDEIAEFHISVRNDGNLRDYIGIDLMKDDTVTIEHDLPEHLYLEEGEIFDFTVKARCSEEGAKEIFVKVYSKYGYHFGKTNDTLRIEVESTLSDSIVEGPIPWIVGVALTGSLLIVVPFLMVLRFKKHNGK